MTAGVINNSGGGGELQWRQTAVVADCSGTVRWRTAAAASDCCGGGVLCGRRAAWAACGDGGVRRGLSWRRSSGRNYEVLRIFCFCFLRLALCAPCTMPTTMLGG